MLSRIARLLKQVLMKLKFRAGQGEVDRQARSDDIPQTVIPEPAGEAGVLHEPVSAIPQPAPIRPRNMVNRFVRAGQLRSDMVQLQEYVSSGSWWTTMDFLVLPQDAHRWGDYWRIFLHIGTNPPRSIGLELHGDVRLGRGVSADFDLSVYDAYDLSISRTHALLSARPQSLAITDLNSKNGTIVNSAYLLPGHPFELFDGDIISLGMLMFVLTVVYRPGTGQTSPNSYSSRTR